MREHQVPASGQRTQDAVGAVVQARRLNFEAHLLRFMAANLSVYASTLWNMRISLKKRISITLFCQSTIYEYQSAILANREPRTTSPGISIFCNLVTKITSYRSDVPTSASTNPACSFNTSRVKEIPMKAFVQRYILTVSVSADNGNISKLLRPSFARYWWNYWHMVLVNL